MARTHPSIRGLATASAFAAGLSALVVGTATAQTELVQWQTNLRPADIEGIEKLVARFHELHPDIRIRIESTPWATHNQKILAAHNAGSGLPDVGRIGNVASAAAIGYVLPLDEHVDEAWRATILDTAWADVTFPAREGEEAKTWAIPKMLATETWYYNKTMFEEAGLDPDNPPQTLDEFVEAARKLTRDTDGDGRTDQWGVALTVNAEGGPYRQYIMAANSFGGRVVAGRNAESEPGDEIVWNSPETIAAFEWLKALKDEGLTPPSVMTDTVRDVANAFRAGTVAMAYMGPWEMAATREVFEANGWEWGLFRWPEGPAGRGEFMYVGALGLFSQTDNVDEAIEYLRFYTSPEGLGLYMKTNGMIPANKEALADPYYSEDPHYSVFLEVVNNADLIVPKWMSLRGANALFDSEWTPIYQEMMAGTRSIEDGVAEMEEILSEAVAD